MAINKLQRSRLTFQPRTLIGVPSIYYNIVFSETIWPIEVNFHMKTPYHKLANFFAKCSGHMTKIGDMPIYGKNPLKPISPEPEGP